MTWILTYRWNPITPTAGFVLIWFCSIYLCYTAFFFLHIVVVDPVVLMYQFLGWSIGIINISFVSFQLIFVTFFTPFNNNRSNSFKLSEFLRWSFAIILNFDTFSPSFILQCSGLFICFTFYISYRVSWFKNPQRKKQKKN